MTKRKDSKKRTIVVPAEKYQEPEYDKQDPYGHYKALSSYEKKRLVATNFWNVAYEKQVIAVPAEDKEYWQQWTKGKMEERAKQITQKYDKLGLK